MKFKIKEKDKVVIITGKDKGKEGEVMKVLRHPEDPNKAKVVIKGLNIRTKHIKKTAQKAGEIVKYEAPMHLSNVMLISPTDNKPTRVGFQKLKGEKKVRIAKKSKQVIDK